MPANIYAGVPEAALQLGATPVLVDIDPRTYNIAVDQVEAALSPRTRAIAVQHSYGHAVDMDPLRRLAEPRGVRILEDAAHALGGAYKGRPTGGLGDVGVFAFSNKGISACGVGGAATAADERLAQDLVDRRYHGRRDGYETHVLGYNFRLTDLVSKLYGALVPETRIPIYDLTTTRPVSWMVVRTPVAITPVTKAEIRSIQFVECHALMDLSASASN